MILMDYVGSRVCEEIEKKYVDYVNKKRLQKILVECFYSAEKVEMNKDIEEVIMNIESDKLKPNLSKSVIWENLKDVFDSVVRDEGEEEFIIKKYKERTYREVLKLYHIQESLDEINSGVNEINNGINEQAKTLEVIDENVKRIPEEISAELRRRHKGELYFIDELDYSKVYFYFELELFECFEGIEEVIDSIFEELEYDLGIKATPEYRYDELLCKVCVEFYNPLQQCLFRKYIKQMDILFNNSEIRIFSISTPY